MSHQEWITKQNDTKPLEAILSDEDGPVNLTGSTVVFSMWDAEKAIKVDERPVTLVAPLVGSVKWPPVAAETDTVGTFRGEFQVTFTDATVVTFPHNGYIAIKILAEVT